MLTELQAALSRKAVLLTATAGFGKTTLMAQWAEMLTGAGRDVAWVTLGHGEGDLQTFFSYVLEALKLVGVDMHQTTPAALPNADFGNMRDMVGHIVNEIAEHPKNVTLIIDDIHHLSDARAHSALRDLIEQSTENFQVTLAGRFLPPIPLSRLRLAGQVMEFTSEELAFDDEEIRQFFSARDLIADPGHLREAREIFGGWPAGMQLLSLAGHRASARIACRSSPDRRRCSRIRTRKHSGQPRARPSGLRRARVAPSPLLSFLGRSGDRFFGRRGADSRIGEDAHLYFQVCGGRPVHVVLAPSFVRKCGQADPAGAR
ncbi:AAA family ATPase [Polaromonas sp. P1(28)-13]|nr:AAA family ATPase [Polaromonas sp. P1(28)-13]